MRKRLISLLLVIAVACSLATSGLATSRGISNFEPTRTYKQGQFRDVAPGAWYQRFVKTVYEQGLLSGTGKNTFSPLQNVTVAQAVVLSARLHATYYGDDIPPAYGGPWYQSYVNYAIRKGIIWSGEFPSYQQPATRGMCAQMLFHALPRSEFPAINNVPDNSLQDVNMGSKYADAIYGLYRAGVIVGFDNYKTFAPNQKITRAELSTIAATIIQPEFRMGADSSNPPVHHSGGGPGYINPEINYPEPPPVQPTGITLSQNTANQLVGESLWLDATVYPWNAEDQSLTWSSSDTDVASVGSSGLVICKKEGRAVITAMTCNGYSDSCIVYVISDSKNPVPVTKVVVIPSTAEKFVGDTLQLSATISPENATDRNMVWTSSNPDIAVVNSSGLVTCKKAGSVVITATATGGKSGTCQLTIKAKPSDLVPVSGVSVAPSTAEKEVGETLQLSATVTPTNATDRNVVWTSSNPDIAVVNSSGLVTCKKAGSVVITAAVAGGKTAVCRLTVKLRSGPSIPITGVSVAPSAAEKEVGETLQLTATVSPDNADDKSVAWTSSNPDIAVVNSDGFVTCKKAGSVVITAAVAGGKTAVCRLTIIQAVPPVPEFRVIVKPSSAKKAVGTSFQLWTAFSSEPSDDCKITWTSSNEAIATVSKDGIVTCKKIGNVEITAGTIEGQSSSCALSIAEVSITPKTLSKPIGATVQLEAKIMPSNPVPHQASWYSSDVRVATVTNEGVVSCLNAGKASITAVIDGVASTCDIEVTGPVGATIPATGVDGLPSSIYGVIDGIVHLSPSVTPANASDKKITWSSSDVDIIRVGNLTSGPVFCKKAGNVIITATCGDYTDACMVEVLYKTGHRIQAEGVTISPTTLCMPEGVTAQLKADVQPDKASIREVTWSSSDYSIATIDPETGLISSRKCGSAVITATADGGLKTSCRVQVIETPVFSGGDGSPESPFLISCKEDLNRIREYPAANYVLVNDLNFTEEDFLPTGEFYNNGSLWTPIPKFSGEFDGQNHKISGLQVRSQKSGGLFDTLEAATVKNLLIENCSVSASGSAGAIAAIGSNSKIRNCIVSGSITAAANDTNKVIAGGIIGSGSKTFIDHCQSRCSVNALNSGSSPMRVSMAGGIVGSLSEGTIFNCTNLSSSINANISEKKGEVYVGGIVGAADSSIIRYCDNRGTVGDDSSGYFSFLGGISGKLGTVQSSSYPVVYGISSQISRCFNSGAVGLLGKNTAGGIVGSAESDSYPPQSGQISDCYNTGTVTYGIAGLCYGEGIKNCYSTGITHYGIANSDEDKTYGCYSGLNSYYLDSASEKKDGAARTEQQFKQKSTFTGYDFDNVWYFDLSSDYLYPQLKHLAK